MEGLHLLREIFEKGTICAIETSSNINSVEMTMPLTQEEIESMPKKSQDMLSMLEISVKDFAKILMLQSLIASAILPVPLDTRYLQRLTNLQPLFELKLQQQSVSTSPPKGNYISRCST